jgi:Uma2 family endonuclease
MTTTQQLMTAEDLWNLPDNGGRRELVKGELREMPPAGIEHGAISMNAGTALAQFVKAHHLGVVLAAETGFIVARGPDTVRGPDVGFIAQARIPPSGLPKGVFPAAPDLAIEVLSPGDTVEEVEEKVGDWLAGGTRLVWVVNPRRRTVTVHRQGPQITVLLENDTVTGEDVVPGFTCQVRELFT